jgi:flagellar motor switch protein FliM
VYPLTFEYVRSEMNTQFANITTPSEVVIAISFTLEFSGNSSELHICLPYSMVEPIRDLLHSAMHSEQASTDNRWTSLLTRQLQTAEVELSATLGTTSITLDQVAHLKVGDVIPIEIGDTLQATVGGVPVMESRYGIQNGQYALKIQRFLAEEEG